MESAKAGLVDAAQLEAGGVGLWDAVGGGGVGGGGGVAQVVGRAAANGLAT